MRQRPARGIDMFVSEQLQKNGMYVMIITAWLLFVGYI